MPIKLIKTCDSCPEQYDAVNPDTNVALGYIRLRCGRFRVECPYVGGELVLEHRFDDLQGQFPTDEERSLWLGKALAAIIKWHEK